MRRLSIILMPLVFSAIANAHTLSNEHDLAESLWHQVSGGHHLPITVGILAGVVALLLARRRSSKRPGSHT